MKQVARKVKRRVEIYLNCLELCVSMFFSIQLQQDIQVRSNEAQRESRKKDKLERELRQARTDVDQKTVDIKTLQTQIERYKQDMTKTEQQLKEQRVSCLIT